MAKFLLLNCALVALLLAGTISCYPSRFFQRNLKPRSIPEKEAAQQQGLLDPKGAGLKPGPEYGVPKDLLNGPKEGYGREKFSGPEGYGQEEGGGPKGEPKYGRGGPEALPGGLFGGPGPIEGLDFGPEGPCMSKRCNPFRSRRPSYRSYLREMKARARSGFGPGPMGPGGYGHEPMGGPQLPVMTEIVIIRKIPILLSKLIVAVVQNPDKYKPGKGPDYGGEKLPEKEPEDGGKLGPVPSVEYADESKEDVLLQDQPKPQKKGSDEQYDLGKSKGQEKPKEKDFDETLGNEEEVGELQARNYPKQGDKGLIAEEGKEKQELKKQEAKLKYDEKEYLEKPEVGAPNKANYEGANELEPRNELDKEKEAQVNKVNGPKY